MAYNYKKIEEVRKDVIGLKIVDFIDDGKVIFLKGEDGRDYTIDITGKDGAVVHQGNTLEGELWALKETLRLLLEKLGIDESDLWELHE